MVEKLKEQIVIEFEYQFSDSSKAKYGCKKFTIEKEIDLKEIYEQFI